MALADHTKIVIGWTILTAIGIYSFTLSKKSVTKRRYEDMKVRERMRMPISKLEEYKEN